MEMAKLIKGAQDYSYIEPTLKLNSLDNNLTLSEDGKYYVSESMSVKTTGIIKDKKYVVSLENAPSGTIVTDTNNNEKNTFNTDETFLVKVPVSSINTLSEEFNINVSATGIINKAYMYAPNNSSYQNVTVLYPKEKPCRLLIQNMLFHNSLKH